MHARTVRIVAGTAVLGLALVPMAALAGADAVEVTAPVQVTTNDSVQVGAHALADASDGYAVAAWTEPFASNVADEVWAATRSTSGTWSAPVKVSDTGTSESVATLSLSSNADGDATAVWRQYDDVTGTGTFRHVVYAATLARGETTWSAQRVGGATYGVQQFHAPLSATLPDGTGVAAWQGWTGPFETRTQQIYVNEGDASGWVGEQQVSGPGFPVIGSDTDSGDSDSVAIGADGSGEVHVVFMNESNAPITPGETNYKRWALRVSRTGEGAWSSPTNMSTLTPYTRPESPFVIADPVTGGFFRGWYEEDSEGVEQIRITGKDTTTFHPPAGSTSWSLSGLSLTNGHADALFYNGAPDGDQTAYTYRVRSLVDGTWTTPVDPTGDRASTVSNGGRPAIATGADGLTTVVWDFGTPRKLYLTQRTAVGAAWDDVRQVTSAFGDTVTNSTARLAAGPAGKTTLLWRRGTDPSTLWSTVSTPDAPAPVMTMTAPSALNQTSRTFTVGWKPTAVSGPVDEADVKAVVTSWKDSGPSSSVDVTEDGPPTGSTSFTGLAGRTYCLGARGSTAVDTGEWSPLRCAVVPVDDRTTTRSGFAAKTGSGWFGGTYLQSTTKGAKITWAGAKAKRLAIRVAKGSGFGSIKVAYAGQSKTISLAGTAGKYVVPLWTFSSLKSGNVVVTVTTAGKTVRVDGLHVGNPTTAFPSG